MMLEKCYPAANKRSSILIVSSILIRIQVSIYVLPYKDNNIYNLISRADGDTDIGDLKTSDISIQASIHKVFAMIP